MRPKVWRQLLIGFGFVLVVMLAVVTPLWGALQGGLQRVLVPVYISVVSLFRSSPSGSTLVSQDDVLSLRASLKVAEASLTKCSLENEQLRAVAAVPATPGFGSLGAEVIGEEADETGKRLLINRGAQDGLFRGLAVVAPSDRGPGLTKVLIGLVSSVSPHIASVILVTAPESKLVAEINNPERLQGLAVGEYNLAVRLRYLPLSKEIILGSPVVTSSVSSDVPGGLLLGTVSSVEKPEGELFQSAFVEPPLSLNRFDFLEILIPNQPTQ